MIPFAPTPSQLCLQQIAPLFGPEPPWATITSCAFSEAVCTWNGSAQPRGLWGSGAGLLQAGFQMSLRLTFHLWLVPSLTLPRPSQEHSGNCRLYTGPRRRKRRRRGEEEEEKGRGRRGKEGEGGRRGEDRNHSDTQSLKYLLSNPLQKNFADLWTL